jgi:NADH dehydrogenase
MGVVVKLNTQVNNINEDEVFIDDDFLPSKNIVWTGGNVASSLLKSLNAYADYARRVIVEKDLSVKNHPNIFVIGDAAAI